MTAEPGSPRFSVSGGVGLDPELIMFGGHGRVGPIFNGSVSFRPGIEFGVGEANGRDV